MRNAITSMPYVRRLVLLSALLYGTDAGRLSLHASAEQGLVEPLKVAIKGRYDEEREEHIKPDIDGKNKKGRVALHLAACNWRGDLEPVRVLLEHGANPDARDRDGLAALHILAGGCNGGGAAAGRYGGVEVARLLHKHGADLNATIEADLLTPLHIAAAGDKAFRLLEWLASKGAHENAIDPLMTTSDDL
jgi:ankyrin repeat protein